MSAPGNKSLPIIKYPLASEENPEKSKTT